MNSEPRTNGHAIRAIRRARGLLQTEVADLAGIDKGYLSRVEAGTRHPRPKVLRSIATALDVDPRHITGQIPPIATLRKLRGLSVQDLADHARISTNELRRLERGATAPTLEQAAVIADRLGCQLEVITPVAAPVAATP